jgi:type II secretory pathway component GspD/PulD (secretin)
VSHVDVKRAWQRRVRSVTSGNDSFPAAELTASVETDFFQQLGDGVRMLLSSSGRVHVDRSAGVVQVTDFADRLDQVGVYIETVTLRASRQVRLNARVLEVSLDSPGSIDWNAVAARAGVTIGTGAGVRVADFNALVQAIGAFGRVHVIASPQFVAVNNEPAFMRIESETAVFVDAGEREPWPRFATTDGLTLSVTSQIGADGVVHMSVSPTWTRHTSNVELDTTMRVREGETVVISGLLRETSARAAAGGLPGARTTPTTTRSELVILLTPTIVTAASPLAGAQ